MAGYNWAAGKSNNAVRAEEAGLRVKSKITNDWLKAGGIDEKAAFIKWLIGYNFIDASEWHHTSKFFNRVDYYSIEDIIEGLEYIKERSASRLEALHKIYANKELRKVSVFKLYDLIHEYE